MNGGVKLLFDENASRKVVQCLAAFFALCPELPEIRHYFEFFPPGEDDTCWIPQAKNEGFSVVSSDRGKRYGGGKLPLICREHRVTHVLYSRSAESFRQWEKARAIIAVWPQLSRLLSTESPGTRLGIRYQGDVPEVYVHSRPS